MKYNVHYPTYMIHAGFYERVLIIRNKQIHKHLTLCI